MFEFTPPNANREYLAVAHPVRVDGRVYGALVAAKPKAELRERWTTLIERLTLAGFFGIVVAGALAWYLSRRITEPVQKLSQAADNIAGGLYEVPEINASGEIGQLAERFREMAARLQEAEELERNFLMTVSHELRTPLTAIRGHVEALREGVVQDEESRQESLDVIAHEAVRLERLVGDVLDLAKLDTRVSRCCTRRSTWATCSSRPTTPSPRKRGGGHRLSAGHLRQAGDRGRRRPRAPDHLEPALERFRWTPTAAA